MAAGGRLPNGQPVTRGKEPFRIFLPMVCAMAWLLIALSRHQEQQLHCKQLKFIGVQASLNSNAQSLEKFHHILRREARYIS
jgi:hypothetical protein